MKPARWLALSALLGAIALLLDPGGGRPGWAQARAQVKKLGEERIADPGPGPRVGRVSFDAAGRLRLDGAPLPPEPEGCSRAVRMLAPRVDERSCPRGAGGPGVDISLLGVGSDGKTVWQRPLPFPSGARRLDRWLLGAAPGGLVLSDLEVWSPATGRTLVPARTHPVGPEARPVPDRQFLGRALYDARRRVFYVFEAEVTLVRREGGLYQVDPAAAGKELLLPVSTTLLGGHDRVEEMALSADGRFLLLAQKLAVRGPGSVSLAVFDLERREVVFLERQGEGRSCGTPQVVAGGGGEVGFAYQDLGSRQYLLSRYRLTAAARP